MQESTGQSGSSPFAKELLPITDERMARITATIESEEFEVISFDIFDTLLTRRFFEPKDLFAYIGDDPALEQELAGWDFASVRANAEKAVRLRLKEAGQRLDPTIDDIYAELISLSGISPEVADLVKQREIETEIACVRPRPAVKQLYDHALRLGKQVILVTDMYLPASAIEAMLDKIGCRGPHMIFHSAETGFTKKHGTIFPHVAEKLGIDPDRFLHFGDNRFSDIRRAEAAGWRTFYLEDYRESLIKHRGGALAGLLPDYSSGASVPNHATKLNYALIMERAFGKTLKASTNTEAPIDASDFGYIALGPFALSLVLWVRRHSEQKGIEKIAWLARDGYLLEKVARLVDEAAGATSQSFYLPISRKMLTPYFVHQRGGIERVLQIGFAPEMTVGQFVEQRFGIEGRSIVESAAGSDADHFLSSFMRDQYHHVAKVLHERIEDLRFATRDSYEALKDFYRDRLEEGAKTAIFDVGRKGTFQSALSSLAGHRLHGFYAVNSYAIQRNAPGRSYDSFLGIIDPLIREKNPDTIIYETVLSERGGSYIGLDQEGNLIRAEKKTSLEEEDFFLNLHAGALEFVEDAIATHGARVTELEQEPFYASYALENWQDHLPSTRLLSSIRHEDSMSTVTPGTLGEYLAGQSPLDDRPQFPPKSEDRRRIAIYCPAITRIRGGAERIAARLANHLHRRGYEVLVYCSGRRNATVAPVYELAPGVHVRNVNTKDVQEMSDLLQAFDPEAALVLASGPVVINVSKALLARGIPYMLSERASPDASIRVYWAAYRPEQYFAAYECASTISVQCRSFKDVFPAHLQRRISILPNPIEMVEPGDAAREKTILCAARVWFEQKRQDILLRAFAYVANQYPDWRLKFFGEPYGNDARELEALAIKLGVARQVDIQPATPDIFSQFERSAIFVLPSSFEGFPNSLAEALATGTPAIGFKSCPGVNELIVDGENGILVEDTDLTRIADSKENRVPDFVRDQLAKRLAAALDTMMSDEQMRDQASVKAKELIREYDAARVLDRWEEEVELLCQQDGAIFQTQRSSAIDAISTDRHAPIKVQTSMPPDQNDQAIEVLTYEQEREQAIAHIRQSIPLFRLKQAIRLLRQGRLNTDWELFDKLLKPNGKVELPIPSNFDERAYLAENPDVDRAVLMGEFQSGYVHFLRHGFAEDRRRTGEGY